MGGPPPMPRQATHFISGTSDYGAPSFSLAVRHLRTIPAAGLRARFGGLLMPRRVVLVGHCNFDGPRLQQEIQSMPEELEVLRVNDEADLREVCEEGENLLLVNREPVGFDEDGVDIVCDVCEQYPDQCVMLVSDFDDAQEQAVEAGAMPGFGKRDMGTPKLAEA